MRPERVPLTAVVVAAPIAVVVAAALSIATPAAFAATQLQAVQDEVLETMSRYRATLERGDLQASVEFYADDPRFRWVEVGRVTYTSKQQIAEALAAYATLEDIRFTALDPLVVALSDTLAVYTTDFEQGFTLSDGTVVDLTGTLMAILEKGDDGWKFLMGQTASAMAPGGIEGEQP